MPILRRDTSIMAALTAVAVVCVTFTTNTAPHASASVSAVTVSQVGGDIDGSVANDYLGSSVALSSNGSRLAVGATGNNGGYVRIQEWNGNNWVQVGADIAAAAPGDSFGASIAMSASGSRVAIGAPGDIEGYVRVYDLIANTWTQVGGDIDGGVAGDGLGGSVSLSSNGSRLAIGVPAVNTIIPVPGRVKVYDWDGNAWNQVGGDIDGEAVSDAFGNAVALSATGSRVAIGAGNNDGSGADAGHVRIYDLIANTWTQVGSDIDGEGVTDQFGRTIALSADGSRVAAGAYGNEGNGPNAGHVRIYDLIANTWTQVGADIDGEATLDSSGDRIAMSADGTRVAIGAPENDGSGPNSGHVRIYDLIANTWVQVGADIDGESADDYASNVALSADGSRVAVGAVANDLNGGTQDSGHVRVHSVPIKPSAPTIVSVVAGDRSLTISFTAGTDGGTAISSYKYSIDGVNYTAFSPAVTTSPLVITGLTNQTTYAVTLKAVNVLGDSTASNSVSGTPSAPAPTTTSTSTTTSTTVSSTSTTASTTSTPGTTVDTTASRLPETGGRASGTLLLAHLLVTGGLVVMSRRRMHRYQR